jgi:hypothetical protein
MLDWIDWVTIIALSWVIYVAIREIICGGNPF